MDTNIKKFTQKTSLNPDKIKSVKKVLEVMEEENMPVNPKLMAIIKKLVNLN